MGATEKLFNFLKKLCLGAAALALVACTQGGGSLGTLQPATGGEGLGLDTQAGPVERPDILVEADPQGDCSPYVQYPDDYEPEEVPENCLEAYELSRNRPQRIPEEPVILIREEPGVIIQEDPDPNFFIPYEADLEGFEDRVRAVPLDEFRFEEDED